MKNEFNKLFNQLKRTLPGVLIFLILFSGIGFSINNEESLNSSISAEFIIKNLADSSVKKREFMSGFMYAFGGLYTLMGAIGMNAAEATEQSLAASRFLMLSGFLYMGAGFWYSNDETIYEMKYKEIAAIEDSTLKEQTAYEVLVFMSEAMKYNRHISSVFLGAIGVWILAEQPIDFYSNRSEMNTLLGGTILVASIYEAFFESYPERMLKVYESRRKEQANLQFNPGIDLKGNLVANWRYSF
jgi:hypothetical protein